VLDYDLFGRRCGALYVTPFLDENLLVERKLGCEKRRYWYTQDGLGSVRQLVTDAGRGMNSYTYTAWGGLVDSGFRRKKGWKDGIPA